MSQTDYEKNLDSIQAINDETITEPKIPVAILLQEAEDLCTWCLPDKELLIGAGMDWSLAENLPSKTGACRYIQSQWQMEYKSQLDSQKEWTVKSRKTFNFRKELLHYFFHAFYNMPDLYAKTQKIAQGRTNAEMIQNLSDISLLGLANQAPLLKINFDLGLLITAANEGRDLATILAKVNGDKKLVNKLRVMRDKAFILLKQDVDEIRRHGQFVFYRNKDKKKGYISNYLKRKKKNASNSKKMDKKSENN